MEIYCDSMRKHLDHEYEVHGKPTGLIPHFWETYYSIGGVYGIAFIALCIVTFYLTVDFYISYSRKQRENKKKRN